MTSTQPPLSPPPSQHPSNRRNTDVHYYDDEGDRSSEDEVDHNSNNNNRNNNNNSRGRNGRIDRTSLFNMMQDDFISLNDTESFNLDPKVMVISPRTGKVLRHLGLKVEHLRDPTPQSVIQEMKQHRDDKHLVRDEEAVQMRLKFKIDTQRRLLSQALRAYELLCQLEPASPSSSPHHHNNSRNRYGDGNSSQATNFDQMSRPADPNDDIPDLQKKNTDNSASGSNRKQLSVSAPSFARAARSSTPTPKTRKKVGTLGSVAMTPSPYQNRSTSGGTQHNHHQSRFSTTSEEDEEDAEALRNAEHIRHANLRRLEQILLKREIMRFKHDKLRDEHEKQLAYERAQDAQKRKKERETAERQNNLQLAREAEYQRQREERQQTILAKRSEFEERTKELDHRWNAKRRRLHQENMKRQQLNEMRRAAQLEIAKQSMEQKRQTAEQGQMISEILLTRRRQEQLDTSHIQMEQKSESSKYRLAEVKARGEALAEARLEKLKEREERQKEIARQQQEQRRREIDKKKEKERIKMERRTQAIVIANKNTKEQKKKVEKAIEAYDLRAEELKERQEHEVVLRKERMREVELSFDLYRERQNAASKAKREELENLVEEKKSRVEDLAQHREARKLRRMQIRQEAEKTRIPIENDLPGPGEYEAHKVAETGRDGPRWSFGVPYSSMGARQFSKTTPSTNYEASPGPAVYSPSSRGIARHRQAAIFAQGERWKEQEEERFPSPGPGEYHSSPSRLHEIDEATLEQTLIGNSGFQLPADEMMARRNSDDDYSDDMNSNDANGGNNSGRS